jgi:uncharacterized membrane protein (UPF0127 family)
VLELSTSLGETHVTATAPRRFSVLVCLVFALAAMACGFGCGSVDGGDVQATPRPANGAADSQALAPKPEAYVELSPAGQAKVRVRVEVVQTPEARAKGLMYRRHLDEDAGMLFLFEEAQPLTFWMRNTYIPLDMIFISSDWKIVGIVEKATPLTDTPRSVFGLSQYVLEVNAGFSFRHGLSAGNEVRFVDANKANTH